MSTTRRPSLGDRRRLVIYSQRFNEDAAGMATRSLQRSTEGRKNQAAYGSRVQRRLRARWYGLVPVKQRTLWAVAIVLFSIVGALGLLHWCAMWWRPIAENPEIARPLRLDQPDSFGTWFGAVTLVVTAGASFLVYQLRRYKSDDYHGHYRIWRVAIVLSLIASVDCVTGLVGWFGGLVDVLLAERDFLAGADWVRLLLGFGGAAFALRMVTEVSRSGWAATVLGLSLAGYAVPLAVRWKLIDAGPEFVWLAVPIVTSFARAGTMLAVVIYLRLLYREVRRIESGEKLAVRIRSAFRSRRNSEPVPDDKVAAKTRPSRRPAKRAENTEVEPKLDSTKQTSRRKVVSEDKSGDDGNSAEVADTPTKRSLWSKIRGAKSNVQVAADQPLESDPKETDLDETDSNSIEPVTKERRSWLKFSTREATPKDQVEDQASQGQEIEKSKTKPADEQAGGEVPDATTKKKGWMAKLMKKASSDSQEAERNEVQTKDTPAKQAASTSQKSAAATAPVVQPAAQPQVNRSVGAQDDDDSADESFDDEPDVDPDSIDWATLNKSERRRMRKVLKRQGKAA